MWHSVFSLPVRKEFLQFSRWDEETGIRADEVHSLTAIAVVRTDRLFMAEESRWVSRAICCCMRLADISRSSSSYSHDSNCVRVLRLPPADYVRILSSIRRRCCISVLALTGIRSTNVVTSPPSSLQLGMVAQRLPTFPRA